MYWDNLDRHHGGAAIEEIWLNHPAVRREANRRVTGDPNRWPLEWFAARMASELPLERSLTIGCGTGALERDLVEKGIVASAVGIDLAQIPLDRARELAMPLRDRIAYERAEAHEFLERHPAQFDAVFFHASLHHFADPHATLKSARSALKSRGVLYCDEYVGPSRDEWNALRLIPSNVVYRLLPRSLRRPRIVRAPINREDPTEAIASSRILPAIRELFDMIEFRGYGGNLLSVVYPNLRRPPEVAPEVFDSAVRRLLTLENALLKLPRVSSYNAVVVARNKHG